MIIKNIQNINFKNYLNFALYTVFLTLFCVSTICALNNDIREKLHVKFTSHQREVLSTATGNLLYNGQKAKVIKVRKNNEFFLEVYGNTLNSQSVPLLLSRISLPFGRDAYINFKGVSSNLALHDIDGDNKLEILVPGYEKNLSARINIYKYDEDQHIFRLANVNFFEDQAATQVY